MIQNQVIRRRIHFHASGRRKMLQEGPAENRNSQPDGRILRVTRLMALAIRLEELVAAKEVSDYATLARLGHVSRARITQIVNLTLLAPEIQEAILFLPRAERGPEPISERDLRPIAAEPDWRKQRRMWAGLDNRLAVGRQLPPQNLHLEGFEPDIETFSGRSIDTPSPTFHCSLPFAS